MNNDVTKSIIVVLAVFDWLKSEIKLIYTYFRFEVKFLAFNL